MPPETYPPPCPYLPPTAPGMVTATGYGYGDGYEAYRPFPSAYRYVQTPPSCSLYAQYPMPAHVSGPAYSTGPYYAPYQNHPYPYEHGSVNHHYQQSTYERYTFDILMNLSTSCMLVLLHCSYFLQTMLYM